MCQITSATLLAMSTWATFAPPWLPSVACFEQIKGIIVLRVIN